VPDGVPTPAIGARVVVSLGSRVVTGIVVATNVGATPRGELKAIKTVLDDAAFVPADTVRLAEWTAEYYACGVGDAIPMLLPPMARGARVDAHKTRRVASITTAGLEIRGLRGRVGGGGVGLKDVAPEMSGAATPVVKHTRATMKQSDVLDLLAGAPHGIATGALAARGFTANIMSRLVRRGYVSLRQERVERDPFAIGTQYESGQAIRRLTQEQDSALGRLRALASAGQFSVALLHGVTGSGKTEVYLRLAAAVRDGGRRVLMLVPEIALTPAVAAHFRDAFGERVAIQHSGLSDGERHDQWQRIRRGDVDVVVGTRSAVFAPLERLGLIVVDEEHDASYKQEESPRYNGRDVAVVRAQRANALAVLGSATPSMETYHNTITGKYARIVLERRVMDRPLASVTVVDMREEYAADGPEVILSRALRDGLLSRLARKEQALVLLNRRGFATAVFCRQCAGTLECPNCSVSLVVHGEGHVRRARCHYCNYTARVPSACPLCAGPYLEQKGYGTERVEAEVRRACPGARVARLDRDAIRRKGALGTLLARFQAGDVDVLVGTQMIAKGHDFPRVTLVGVVSADVGLGLADFRASERTFQLLTQVAGRAGRGDLAGEAIVQTLYPGHYSVELACRQDFVAFYRKEMQFRKTMRYPPAASLVNAVVRARTLTTAIDDAADIALRVRTEVEHSGDVARNEVRVLGPAPAPLGKLRGEYRAQILLKGPNRKKIREALRRALATRPDVLRRVIVDVDPLSVL
jgi:primosomal protein N' (replication factor Y)